MQPTRISLLLKTASDLQIRGKPIQIEYLRTIYNEPLRYIIQGALHPGVEWLLPKGPMIYTSFNENADLDSKLYREYRKLYIFCKGGNDKLNQQKRENLFIQLLESLHSEDAELLIYMKDKSLPYPGITYDLICDAYPGMLPEKREEKEDVIPDETEELLKKFNQERPILVPIEPNKGKRWYNNGVKDFLVSLEEAEKNGYVLGRLLNPFKEGKERAKEKAKENKNDYNL
jgi:hypothetical protein